MSEKAGDSWAVSRLVREHEVGHFACGEMELDRYLKQYSAWNDSVGFGRTFVACEMGSLRVAGYYTMSSSTVQFEHLPERKGLPYVRYPIPVALVGRLAVDGGFQGRGLGEMLLMDALARAERVAGELAIHAVSVHAKHERAKAFYLRYGFVPMRDDPLHLYLPMRMVRQLGLNA